MPRGMRRTVIMSHGRDHDARGVKGTFRKGSAPDPTVLKAIPENLGVVGNVPENTRPGDPAATLPREAKQITTNRRVAYDEGIPVLPGGNRDTTLGTSRPGEETISPDKVETQVTTEEQVPATLSEPPLNEQGGAETVVEVDEQEVQEPASEPAQEPEAETTVEEPEAAQDELSDAGTAEETVSTPEEEQAEEPEQPDPPLPTSKRKLIRAKVDDLRSWCGYLEIIPEEYVESDDQVTGDLMRVLVGDKLGIDHGITLPDEE